MEVIENLQKAYKKPTEGIVYIGEPSKSYHL